MQTILFDLDGTLVDSVADLAAAANFVRRDMGRPPLPDDVVASFIGDGAKKLIERAFSDVPGLDVLAVLKRFRAHYYEHCTERTTVYPGVMDALEALMPRPMAIVSNKPEDMCVRIATHYGLDRFLPVVVGQVRGEAVKPDSAMLLRALRGLDVEQSADVWMVGDSHNDVLSGRAVGATTVGVGWGIGDARRRHEAKPDHEIARVPELVALLGG